MAVLKQKSIKPATDIPYAEGILVYNNTGADIPADRLVTFFRGANTGTVGASITVELAPMANGAGDKLNPLLVTKHLIPTGKRGVCLPWKTFTGLNTSALSVGDIVYLSATADGQLKITAGAPTHRRVVGIVTVDSATVGEVFVAPTMMLPMSSVN